MWPYHLKSASYCTTNFWSGYWSYFPVYRKEVYWLTTCWLSPYASILCCYNHATLCNLSNCDITDEQLIDHFFISYRNIYKELTEHILWVSLERPYKYETFNVWNLEPIQQNKAHFRIQRCIFTLKRSNIQSPLKENFLLACESIAVLQFTKQASLF